MAHSAQDRPTWSWRTLSCPLPASQQRRVDIEWWTGMPTPCVLETGDGTPSYLGGWVPRDDLWGRLRDKAGRWVIRSCKRTFGRLLASRLKRLGMNSIYRPDGLEAAYSPSMILGFGLREFEFPPQLAPALRVYWPADSIARVSTCCPALA